MDPIREAYEEQAYGTTHRPLVPIVQAELGEQAGAVGAALLGRRPRLSGAPVRDAVAVRRGPSAGAGAEQRQGRVRWRRGSRSGSVLSQHCRTDA